MQRRGIGITEDAHGGEPSQWHQSSVWEVRWQSDIQPENDTIPHPVPTGTTSCQRHNTDLALPSPQN